MEIRRATSADACAVLDIYSPFVAGSHASFEDRPPGLDDVRARIRDSLAWFVAESEGEIEGYAYASPFHPRPAYRWSVEVSVYVAPGGQGRGVGRELLATLLADLHECGYVNAFAGIALPNDASVHLFESFGFEQIARQREVGFKLGEWHDVGWWQLHLRDRCIPPPDIRMRAQAAGADEAPA